MSDRKRDVMPLQRVKELLRAGPYAWPGGYPMFFVCADGEPMSFTATRQNWRQVVGAHSPAAWSDRSFAIAAVEVNWEDRELRCCVNDERIPSAYSEDEATE